MPNDLKSRTANTLKWNLLDRVMQQVLYAVTGIVLARMLAQEDFGLVGAVLVFQAFASILVDSGFSFALIQRKSPTQTDYSSVFWFNILISAGLYLLLWFCAPLIARCFDNDLRLIPLSRVLFLSLIINATTTVQINRLMKKMDVRWVALSNAIALAAGAVVGIYFAVTGAGPWAIVWQTLTSGCVRSLILWFTSGWLPDMIFSVASIKSFIGIGSRMALTSLLNTIFLQIYSFVIGAFVGLRSLGFYTQADKWSKMGVTSITQTLTSSFVPTLSSIQDDRERLSRVTHKMNRFTAYLLFPAMIGLAIMATPIFHLLFGQKWDPSILLFQLLLIRGIFVVLNSLYSNFLLAIGQARAIMWLEVFRDSIAIVALIITFPYMALTTPTDPVYGLTILLWGQLITTALTYIATLIVTCRLMKVTIGSFIRDLLPYALLTMLIAPLMIWVARLSDLPLAQLLLQATVGLVFYYGINYFSGSKIQSDVISYLRGNKNQF